MCNNFLFVGDGWSSLQAVQDPCHQEVHRQSAHRHAPEAEGEPQEVLQGQEVQASGPETQEDQSHSQGSRANFNPVSGILHPPRQCRLYQDDKWVGRMPRVMKYFSS